VKTEKMASVTQP